MKNFLCKQLKHTKFITALSLFLLHSAAYSAVTTNGFWNAGTINGVSFPANGTGAQLTSPEQNPDVFCQLQGAGWRVPTMEEFNLAYKGKKALTGNNNATDGLYYSRRVGSLISEWGSQPSLFSNSGWTNGTFWAAEPSSTINRHRFDMVNLTTGNLTAGAVSDNYKVACAITL